MEEGTAFLSAIRSEPGDDTLRLVYADWLEERGDPLAEFLRVEVDLVRRRAGGENAYCSQERLAELARAAATEWLATVNRVPLVLCHLRRHTPPTLGAPAWSIW